MSTIPTVALPNGIAVPALGQGTWMMGEKASEAPREIDSLKAGIDLGMTLIDTAEMYADGGAEKIVGEAIKGQREKLYIVSKVYPHNASGRGTIAACERSLKRMGIETIDLYLLHWRGEHPLAETVAAFETLKQQGKIGAWGVSNFDTDDMEELVSVPGGSNVASNQILYNLARRGPEYDLIPFCKSNNVSVMAYSPIERGVLLKHPELIRIAKAYQATPAQLALAYLIRQDNVIAIPKTSSRERAAENADAGSLRVSDADWSAIDAAFPAPKRKTPLEMI